MMVRRLSAGVIVPLVCVLSVARPALAAPAGPDLTTTAAGFAGVGNVLPGGSFTASDTAKNAGKKDAGASTTRYYLSPDGSHSPDDALLSGQRSVPSLAKNASSSGSATVGVPAATEPGSYYLLACADDLSQVTEQNESNNCKASTGTLVVKQPAVAKPQADLRLTMSDEPDPVIAGAEMTYTVVVHNFGPATATGVQIIDELPPEVAFVSASALCTELNHRVTCLPGTIPSGHNFIAQIVVRTISAEVIENRAAVQTETADWVDPVPFNNTDTETTVVQPGADLELSLVAPSTAAPGSEVSYEVTVTNHGPQPAQSVSTELGMSEPFTFLQSSPGNSCVPSGGNISCTQSTLAVGATLTVTIRTQMVCADISVLALVRAATGDPQTANNSAAATTQRGGDCADLALTVTHDQPSSGVAVGGVITYSYVARNNGPDPAFQVFVDASVTNGVIEGYTATPSLVCSPAVPPPSAAVSCGPVTLGAAEFVELTLTVRVQDGPSGTTSSTGTVRDDGASFDPDPTNDTATASAPTFPVADLAIDLSVDKATAAPGDRITYTYVGSNNGPASAQDVVLQGQLPGEVTGPYTVVPGPGVSCGPVFGGEGQLTCTVPALAAGDTFTVSVTGTIADYARGTLTNSATVDATTADPATANNSDTVTTEIPARSAALLDGSQEVPPTGSPATGQANVTVARATNEVCYQLTVDNLLAPATAAHIHQAPAGVNGPVVVPLSIPVGTTSFTSSGCTTVTDALADAIALNPADFYVNVHSTVFPGGEIRGQLESTP